METGRRSDIVLSDGLRCTSFLRFPDDQSRYSVESAVAQNFLSSSSLLNSGSAFLFVFRIGLTFLAVHVADRDRPYQIPSDRERHKQSAAGACLSQRVVSLLAPCIPLLAPTSLSWSGDVPRPA